MKRLSKQRMIMKKQVQNIFQERDVLTVAENPFAIGLWCSFQTEVRDVVNLFSIYYSLIYFVRWLSIFCISILGTCL